MFILRNVENYHSIIPLICSDLMHCVIFIFMLLCNCNINIVCKQNDKKFTHCLALKLHFLYARLKNGRIMLYPPASVRPSVRPSVCKLFRFRVTPPTVYVRLS